MYALEITFTALTLALLLGQASRRASHRALRYVFVGGILVLLLATWLGQVRIPLAPAMLVFLISSLFLLKHSHSHVALRAIGVFLGSTLIAISVLLALALPVVTLPEPDGPHIVGVTSFTLVDESRTEATFGAPDRLREVYVQAWYPGEVGEEAPAAPVRTLWQELYRSAIGKLVFGYLSGIDTHSVENIPVSAAPRSYPVVIFSPALAGIAEQNTLLMEHLASHGYIVFAVTHPYFGIVTAYPDGTEVPVSDVVFTGMSQQAAVDLDAISDRVHQSGSPVEQAAIWLEYFGRAEALNDFIEVWVRDLTLVLDAVSRETQNISAQVSLGGRVDPNKIGFMGMSFGGGAVTHLCKQDSRCRAAINLDGGLWGRWMRQFLDVPYLVLSSPGNQQFFEHDLLTSQAP